MPSTSSERRLIGSLASHARWAATEDRTAATDPARKKFNDRFADQVDPDHKLTPAERAIRAEHARRAYFAGLALKSAQARRKSREHAAVADAADAELNAGDAA